jgi:hypothetical protein
MAAFDAARKPFVAPVSGADREILDHRHQIKQIGRLGQIDEGPFKGINGQRM